MSKNESKGEKRVAKSIIASTVGFALVLSGSTYALWTATVSPDTSAVIANGNLDVIATDSHGWFDIRDAANPIAVDLASYLMVPADKISLKQDLKVVIFGGQTSGKLTVKVPNNTQDRAILEQAKFTLILSDGEGKELKSATAELNTKDSFTLDIENLPPTDELGDDYTVEVIVELPESANDDTKLQTAILGNMIISLEQGEAYKDIDTSAPTITTEASAIPLAHRNTNFDFTLSGTGEEATYEIIDGALPVGMTLDSTTGKISGRSNVLGVHNFTVRKTNAYGEATKALAIDVRHAPPTMSRTTIPNPEQGIYYVSYFGGTGDAVTYSVVSGALPKGITLDGPNARLVGTATERGSFSFTIRKENNGGFVERQFSGEVILAAPTITNSSIPYSVKGENYEASLSGVGENATYTAENLPPGLSINSQTGVISGSPTTIGTYRFTVTKTNAAGTVTRQISHTVKDVIPEFITEDLPQGQAGVEYSFQLEAYGRNIQYSASLPSGLSIDSTTGLISGTPKNMATTNVTITLKNTGGTVSKTIPLTIISEPPTLTTESFTNAIQSEYYYQKVDGAGQGNTHTVTAGELPPGLSISDSNGNTYISGRSNAYGTYNFTLTRTNGGGSISKDYSITVAYQTPTITNTSLSQPRFGQAYSDQLSGFGNGATYSIEGKFPAGLSLNTETGLISGTPTAIEETSFTITKTNTSGSASKTFTMNVIHVRPSLSSASTPDPIKGEPYSWQVPSHGDGIVYSITGNSISGLTLDPATGIFSGVPTTDGSFLVTVQASNTGGSVSQPYSFTVRLQAPKTVTTLSLPDGQIGVPYSAKIEAEGEKLSYSFANSSGPAGLSIDSSTGVISGTPTRTNGTSPFNVQIRVSNSGGVLTHSIPLMILPIVPTITTQSLPSATYNLSYSQSLTGGGSDSTYSIVEGTLPSGIRLAPNGSFSGSTTVVGSHQFTVLKKNLAGEFRKQFTLEVKDVAPTLTTTTIPKAQLDTIYNQPIYGAGSNATVTVVQGKLPTGLELQDMGSYWRIYGKTSELGPFDLTLRKSNSAGYVERSFAFEVTHVAPTLSGNPPTAFLNVPYSGVLPGTGLDVTYTSTALPAGFTLDAKTGEIKGTGTTLGTYTFTVTKTNSGGSANRSITFYVRNAPPTAATTTLPEATVGVPYSSGIYITGENISSVSIPYGAGSLPTGLSLNRTTGEITGTPSRTETSTFTISATNDGGTLQQNFKIVVK